MPPAFGLLRRCGRGQRRIARLRPTCRPRSATHPCSRLNRTVATRHCYARSCLAGAFHIQRRYETMTTAILIGGPLTVVLGSLYWVMSLYKQQHALNVELWKKHGVKL